MIDGKSISLIEVCQLGQVLLKLTACLDGKTTVVHLCVNGLDWNVTAMEMLLPSTCQDGICKVCYACTGCSLKGWPQIYKVHAKVAAQYITLAMIF